MARKYAPDTVTNVAGHESGIAIFGREGSGFITNNIVTTKWDGIDTNFSHGTQISGNTVIGAGTQGFTDGNGWGLGWCVVRKPQGVTAVFSPGTFGHGGAYGTQAWIDPGKGRIYILMIQRADFPNSDASEVRRSFQEAANSAPGLPPRRPGPGRPAHRR